MSLSTLSGRPIYSIMLGTYEQDRYTVTSTMLGEFQIANGTFDLPVDLSFVPDSTFGLALVEIEAQFGDGLAKYVWTYEGVNKNLFFDGSTPVLEIDGHRNVDPITMHPLINYFISKYSNGPFINGKIDWKQYDPDGKTGTSGLEITGNKVVNNISPLYGVESYQSASASMSYEEIYTKETLPTDLVSLLGTIVPSLPDVLDPVTDSSITPTKVSTDATKRNWLYSGVRLFQQGNGFVVRKYFSLSGLGGWMKQLYDPSWQPPTSNAALPGAGSGTVQAPLPTGGSGSGSGSGATGPTLPTTPPPPAPPTSGQGGSSPVIYPGGGGGGGGGDL